MNPLPHKLHVIPHVVLMLFGNFWQYPRDLTDWQESRSYTSAHTTESNNITQTELETLYSSAF